MSIEIIEFFVCIKSHMDNRFNLIYDRWTACPAPIIDIIGEYLPRYEVNVKRIDCFKSATQSYLEPFTEVIDAECAGMYCKISDCTLFIKTMNKHKDKLIIKSKKGTFACEIPVYCGFEIEWWGSDLLMMLECPGYKKYAEPIHTRTTFIDLHSGEAMTYEWRSDVRFENNTLKSHDDGYVIALIKYNPFRPLIGSKPLF